MPMIAPELTALLAAADARLPRLAAAARPRYRGDDPGHDWLHIVRVTMTAAWLGREADADLTLLLPAALLHDLVNLRKDDPDRALASSMAADEARNLLSPGGYDQDETGRIAAIIAEHSYTAGRPPSSLESAILQDADKLDALGAIGLLRAATCGTRLGSQFYDEGDPFVLRRSPDDRRFLLDHFYAKLLHLDEQIHTAAAKTEARLRIAFLGEFMAQMERELSVASQGQHSLGSLRVAGAS